MPFWGVESGSLSSFREGGENIDKPIEPTATRLSPREIDPGGVVDLGPWKYSCPDGYVLKGPESSILFSKENPKCWPIKGSD
jgi:hypothetical protein